MSTDTDFTHDLSDAEAVRLLTAKDSEFTDRVIAATHLEVSINGGDVYALRLIAFALLTSVCNSVGVSD